MGQGKMFDIEVKTADKLWAGTDDTVRISITGDSPDNDSPFPISTGMFNLDNDSRNDFERGDLSTFEIGYSSIPAEAHNLTKMTSLTVEKVGSDDWNLDWIKGMVSNRKVFEISGVSIVNTVYGP